MARWKNDKPEKSRLKAHRPARISHKDRALIDAAERGDWQQLNNLLGEGADPNATDKWGCTALIRAARWGHFK